MNEPRRGPRLVPRPWVPPSAESFVQEVAASTAASGADAVEAHIEVLVELNRSIHERECVNLNPAANVMNPRAEELLASGLGSRPSLGYPTEKYETGLEAIEELEVVTAELAAEVFDAGHAEIRVASGAMANLYAFMACARPGDALIVPPATIGGHVTHNRAGAAGLFGLEIHQAPVDGSKYTIDVDGLAEMARAVRPALISVGGSLNLIYHPIDRIAAIAAEVGAKVLFDAAHLSGLIAGGAWPHPLHEGADLMTMSTYKSLGGPAGGLVVTDDGDLAERLDAIAFPGLTANFDAATTTALAVSLLDWKEYGSAYAAAMVDVAQVLADELVIRNVPLVTTTEGRTTLSHAFAIDARQWGGDALARRLRRSNLLASSIGTPEGSDAGLRVGTNEIVRWGMAAADMPELADLIGRAVVDDASVAADVSRFRRRFTRLHYVR